MEPQRADGPSGLAAHCERTARSLRLIAVLIGTIAALGAVQRLASEPRGIFGILADATLLLVLAWGMWACGSSLRSEARRG